MTEAGLPDLTIMAQVGHVSPAMMNHYSHIRRQALNQAAVTLEPNYSATPTTLEMVNLLDRTSCSTFSWNGKPVRLTCLKALLSSDICRVTPGGCVTFDVTK